MFSSRLNLSTARRFGSKLASATNKPHQPAYRSTLSRPLTSSATASTAVQDGFSTFAKVSAASALALSVYTIGSIYPPSTLSILFPRAAPAPADNPDSPESQAYTQIINHQLTTLPLLQSHRSQADADEWYEARPYINLPEERRVNNLTAGALRGPGKLAVPPFVRARKDESEAWIFIHVGRGLCGHDGIIHGGLLATLLDESLARIAINNLPDRVGVTANLSINYRAPTTADQFIVIKTTLVEKQGRKTRVQGRVEDMNGTLLVEASAMFVQPRYAKMLNTTALKQVMGEPIRSDTPVHLGDGEKLQKL